MLDSLELEPTYNPLQICSRLYSHLNSTFAKPQGRLHPSWESRALRKVQLAPLFTSLPPLYAQIPRDPSSLIPNSPQSQEVAIFPGSPLVEGRIRPGEEEKEGAFTLAKEFTTPPLWGLPLLLGH